MTAMVNKLDFSGESLCFGASQANLHEQGGTEGVADAATGKHLRPREHRILRDEHEILRTDLKGHLRIRCSW